ncbi:FAD:protein FMN transferase [Slackia heliotrinireducens]|uniref:FAD:protein FMN transferase n=1 Tax=Slackia heliotrinireducens TaxID=84110 RepID=UPI0033146C7B
MDVIPLEDEYLFTPAGDPSKPHTAQFYAFNTEIVLSAFGDAEAVRAGFADALAACRRFEHLFSRTLSHSDVTRINTAGGKPVPIAEDTARLLEASLGYCERSLGVFDITMGSVTRLWNFVQGVIPTEEERMGALSHVDWRGVHVRTCGDGFEAWLDDPLAAIDLGGTAKGFIADALVDLLDAAGIRHILVNLGGNVAVRGGKPGGEPYVVGVRNPKDPASMLCTVRIADGSVVTSGLYERAFELDGKRYCHILSPKDGLPISTDAESVTLIAARSADCDGFSTTLCALGIEDGLAYAKTLPEITGVVYIDAENNVRSWSR